MTIDINLDNCEVKELPVIQPNSDKGWGYSFVYNLKDLRNIYLLMNGHEIQTTSDLLVKFNQLNITSDSKRKWTTRNILELVNAWINFGYVSSVRHGYKVTKSVNFDTTFNFNLNEHDKDIFKRIFKEYYKFNEFHVLFRNKNTDLSWDGYVYAFSKSVRFVNCFLTPEKKILWTIDNNHKDMMRFWDVYLNWGTKLDYIDKISLSAFNVNIIDSRLRKANMIYTIKEMPNDFSILEYVKNNMPYTYLSILDIEFDLINKYQFKIDSIKEKIIQECSSAESDYRLQSTSSNFIKRNDHRYYPMVSNTFVSHLLKVR